MDARMYLGVGNEVGRAGSQGLGANAHVWGGGEVVTYLHP
jgi:hypothetical protein